jgi:2-polyprenyl-3-methyl-5-hydroxy-6-metoxy-1,4-benzoquinol methylase
MSFAQEEEESADDFSSRMVEILNASALNVAIGMGSKTGLFEALDAASSAQSPLTVEELANAARLNPRVVREWLGIVVSGNIVEVLQELDDDNNNDDGGGGDERFWLPSHRAPALCRRGGGSNLSLYCQEIPILTNCVYQQVLDSFTTGSGIPYSSYPPFQDFMNHLANQKHQDTLIQTFLPSIGSGMMVDRLKEGSMRVMDLGCGQGVAITLLAREFSNSTFVGIDLDQDAIAIANKAQETANDLTNLSFVVLDVTHIHEHELFAASFDYVMAFDAIHDLCHPEQVLKGIHSALKPGGMFSMIDIKADSCIHSNKDHPMGPLLYTVSLMHCMQVAMVDGGKGLGMMWGRQKAIAMLEEAGFRNIKELDIPNDGFNLHFMAEKE